ncbi:MFS transporter [Epilithonimonas sp. JDS]|uniref:MFS transporter n=1 Tax=Epilithonimonas sp. JDS TaxID=2902797 RepID=UPI001E4D21A4|nr:MFS transporter [Epilithonimonas sp. JDS]MCD9856747.1 MFS transporter [Epilithonimonas sp. JDS]
MIFPALNESRSVRYFTFFYLYVMQGIPAGFATTAICNFLASKGLELQLIGTFAAIIGIPWILQVLWGPIIDRYQYSVIGHRKHWLVFTQVIACIASLLLLFISDPVSELNLLTLVFFVHSVFASVQDASADAIAIEVSPKDQRGKVNAFMRGGFLVGYAVGAALLSWVMHQYGFRAAVILQTFILFVFTIITFLLKFDRKDPILPHFGKSHSSVSAYNFNQASNPTLQFLFSELYKSMTARKNLVIFSIILSVYFIISFFISGYTYYIIHFLNWPDKDVSILQGTWGSVLTLSVILLGGVLSDRIGSLKLMSIVMAGIGIYLVVICSAPNYWTIKSVTKSGLILWNFVDPLFSVAAFPLLMNMCRDRIQGSQFTAYMALINFSGILGTYTVGWAQILAEIYWFGLICGVLITLAAIYMRLTYKNSGTKNVAINDNLNR